MEENPDSDRYYERTADDPSPSGQGTKEQSEESPLGDHDLPIMQWEDLSLRIAELERQEEERRKKAESLGLSEQDRILGCWTESKHHSLHREPWADENNYSPCRVPVITSRFNSPKNLQLCFINNSESEEEEDDEGASSKESSCEAEVRGSCSRGLKQEVKAALRTLRDKLWAEQKEKEDKVTQDHIRQATHSSMNIRRKILSLSDLQTCSLLQLNALRASLNEDIQDLSSELVKHLVVRDHLRTKQDALLLDVQDMTSL
ncbi:schwannomin-interacting protein 1-like isoform X1 [Sinocyclocheilus rhinocerous]|uniref:schwannomin-interacting protein 1-like isoform X1 n=1 Tax=Sinocyclocheilus rhinocerous TaxID=307959 RepID=UPI0007BA5D53|nr:PREDICTED: schwannomin-interacting protein 1-like isoform X1 [Sinocyclocheilus rhinocerous]